MPSIPIWGVVILISGVVFIIGYLLFSMFRYRRSARSTVDSAEYLDKKQGLCTFDINSITPKATKSNSPTIQTTSSSTRQPYTHSITRPSPNYHSSPVGTSSSVPLSERSHDLEPLQKSTDTSQHRHHHHNDKFQIPLSLPSTDKSFVSDELSSEEAGRTLSLCRSNSPPNQHDFVSIDLAGTDHQDNRKTVPAFYDTINTNQKRATSTIKSNFHNPMSRQKSLAKKMDVHQLFDLSTRESVNNNVADTDSATSLPPSPPPKDNSPPSPSLSSIPPTPSTKGNVSPSSHEDTPKIAAIPLSPFHQFDDEASREDLSAHQSPLLSLGIGAKAAIGMEPTSCQLLEYQLDSMFAWLTIDDEEEDDVEDANAEDGHHYNNADTGSVTSGSVHRLVRDSIVSDADHQSLAARSITSSIRPSLHDMASWWPLQDKLTNHIPNSSELIETTEINPFDANSPLSPIETPIGISVQDPLQLLSQSKVASESASGCRLPSKTTKYTSSPTSTYSRATLNRFRLALANGDQEQESESEVEQESESVSELAQTKQEASVACQSSTEVHHTTLESSIKYAVSDSELSSSTFQTSNKAAISKSSPPPLSLHSPKSILTSPYDNDDSKPITNATPISVISTVSNQPHRQVAPGREFTSAPAPAPAPALALASIRSSPRNSTIGASGNGSSSVDSIRRELQTIWNTHRLSDQGSIASSTRSSASARMSPPASVNPRQLNQHLVSMSLQVNGRSQHRPGLPIGFINEEMSEQGGGGSNHAGGPQPTVSFSSSTVRTMIPENESIDSHLGRKNNVTLIQHQSQPQNQKKTQPKKETTTTTITAPSNSAQEQSFVGTMRANRQQRGSIPWSSNTNTNDKTPAQRERDRYLQSLNK